MKNRLIFTVILCVLAFAAALTSGCALRSGPDPTARVEDVIAQESGSRQEIRQINERFFAAVKSAPKLQDYVLGEGDFIQVSVFEAQELKTEGRVSARGFITLPLVGAVEVKGLTTREAEQKIETIYRAKYLQNPHVNIYVKEQVSGKITIMGSVKKPGTHPYLARQNLFEALASAEGLSENAGKMVQVRRVGDDPDHPTTFLVDLDELVRGGGGTDLNMEIKTGDVIYVPEAGMIYVDGAVRKPGNYPMKQKMSIPEAIVAAGGFAQYADEDKIKLVRKNATGKADVVQLSFKDLQLTSDKNIEVKDRDIIFVETNKMQALIYGLRITGLGGIVGVGYEPPRPQ
ncbi:MAG: polysaccharide biosynthesis/export family protein [Syntrophobacteraceae bacterium]